MLTGLLISTILLPIGLGLVCGGLSRLPRLGPVLPFLIAATLMLIYVDLEGLPAFPPNSAKLKLFYLLPAAAVLVAMLPRHPVLRGVVAAILALAAALWLGINRFAAPGGLASSLHILAPVIAVGIGLWRVPAEGRGEAPLAPLTVALVWGAGLAALSALGLFVGFAQAAGAFAAFAGGMLAIRYLLLVRGGPPTPAPSADETLLLSILAVGLVIGLLAPELDKPAFVVLSLVPALAGLLPAFRGGPAWLRPILQGVIAAVPAVIAVLIALF